MATNMITFVHSLFRSGSTYFFEAIRRDSPDRICFQESFHEIAFKYKEDPCALIKDISDNIRILYRHPHLSRAYFAELVDAWPTWSDKINLNNVFRFYFRLPGQDCGKEYWESLAGSTIKPVVFEETRTTGKIGALKHCLADSFHIYLLRNPWDQWFSYKVDAYFEATILAIINADSRPASCLELARILSLLKPKTSCLFEELDFYQNNLLPPRESYLAFFMVWSLGLVEAIKYCDLTVSMDRLNRDYQYRQEIQAALGKKGISISFNDYKMAQSIYLDKDKDFFQPIEECAYRILEDSGWQRSQIDEVRKIRKETVSGIEDLHSHAFHAIHHLAHMAAKSASGVRHLYLESQSSHVSLRSHNSNRESQLIALGRNMRSKIDAILAASDFVN